MIIQITRKEVEYHAVHGQQIKQETALWNVSKLSNSNFSLWFTFSRVIHYLFLSRRERSNDAIPKMLKQQRSVLIGSSKGVSPSQSVLFQRLCFWIPGASVTPATSARSESASSLIREPGRDWIFDCVSKSPLSEQHLRINSIKTTTAATRKPTGG